ncbi:amidase [Rhodobacteraceae bacterium 63075]|nr:amidase [Rhodobacteraceae bacterium 63075]
MSDWLSMTMADLGRDIEGGAIDPRDLTAAYLDAIEAHEHKDRIYARTTRPRAEAEAAAGSERAKAGLRRGPLDGIPISWKDLFDTAGIATEAGSKLLEGRTPDTDAEVLKNATYQGLVCLGKTHMSELAFSGLGLNPSTGTPPCINDASAVAGGSSSGAAASVAFGLAPCGIGSDTAGSVRIPAAWNDLVGLKTTAGRVSLSGVVDLCARFDTVGPLCRTVEDAALMLAALEGRQPADLAGTSLKGRRLAVLETVACDDLREAPKAAFDSALARLQAQGAELHHIEAPEAEEALSLAPVLFAGEAYGRWHKEIEAAPEKMFGEIRERFRGGKDFSAPEFVSAWIRLDALRRTWQARFAGFDAVLTPTAANLPPDAERLMSDSSYYIEENLLALRNTRIGNLMGLSAVTLPTGTPSCGLQLLGAPFGEERLLRIASAAEAALS